MGHESNHCLAHALILWRLVWCDSGWWRYFLQLVDKAKCEVVKFTCLLQCLVLSFFSSLANNIPHLRWFDVMLFSSQRWLCICKPRPWLFCLSVSQYCCSCIISIRYLYRRKGGQICPSLHWNAYQEKDDQRKCWTCLYCPNYVLGVRYSRNYFSSFIVSPTPTLPTPHYPLFLVYAGSKISSHWGEVELSLLV